MFRRQVTVLAPPGSVFQLLYDPTMLEEYTKWKVRELDDEIGVGYRWEERKGLRKRVWTMTAFERRGFSFTATTKGLSMTLSAKKGGRMSCNVVMKVEGEAGALRRFERTDGDRLERMGAYLNE